MRRPLSRPAVLGRVAAALAAVAIAGAALPVAAVPAGAAALPYTDTRASGTIGLCDREGHLLTSGDIATTPFLWRAVATSAAPALYGGAGRTATLYAFQPRPQVPPAEWSGEQLTSSTRYGDPRHPIAQFTGGDLPLADFLAGYPPLIDGLIQLRIVLGAPQQPPLMSTYAATDIRISGHTWSVVRGRGDTCAGTAVSLETLTLPSSYLTAPPSGVTTTHSGAASSGAHASAGSVGSLAAQASAAAVAASNSSGARRYPDGSPWWWAGVAGAVLAYVGWRRMRSRAGAR